MSRGFVKEDDLEHAGTDVPERPISAHANYMTEVGFLILNQQLNGFEKQKNQLSQDKESTSAQQQLAVLNRDIRYLTARIESAIVSKPDSNLTVVFGATVTVENTDGETQSYHIVGEDEADVKCGKISWASPLAKALIGQKVGDDVTWKRPAGDLNLSIVKIVISKPLSRCD